MSSGKPGWWVLLIVLSVILVACGGAGGTTPTADTSIDTADETPQDVTEEVREEPTEVAMEEATDEATEEAVGEEMTEEATEEAEPTEVAMEEATDEATEAAAPTEAAAEEATEEATAEATDEAMELDAIFTSEDGTVTFDYPSSWVVEERAGNQFMLASSQEALDITTGAPGTGEFRAVIFVNPVSTMPELSTGATSADVLDAFMLSLNEMMTADTSEATAEATEEATEEAAGEEDFFGEVSETTIGDHDASRVAGSRDDSDAVAYAVDLGDDVFAMIVGASAPGELADFEPTLLAIAETITYTPADAGEATEEAGDIATQEATEETSG